jgi:hypothetical protein
VCPASFIVEDLNMWYNILLVKYGLWPLFLHDRDTTIGPVVCMAIPGI